MNFDRTVVPARFTAAVRENESLARYIVVDARTAPILDVVVVPVVVHRGHAPSTNEARASF